MSRPEWFYSATIPKLTFHAPDALRRFLDPKQPIEISKDRMPDLDEFMSGHGTSRVIVGEGIAWNLFSATVG